MVHTPGGAGVADRLAAAARAAREARVSDVRAEILAALAVAGGALGRDDAVLAGTLLATALANAGRIVEARRELVAVRPLLPGVRGVRRARFHVMAAYLAHSGGDDEQAISELVEALAILDGEQEPTEELATVLANCSAALGHTQLFTLGVGTGERAAAVAAEAGLLPAPQTFQAGYAYLTWALRLEHLRLGEEACQRWRSAAGHFETALHWSEQLGTLFAATAHVYLSLCRARLGDPVAARSSLAAARLVPAEQSPELLRMLRHGTAAVLLAEGWHSAAREELLATWDEVRELHRPPWTEDVAYLLGAAAEAVGDTGEALRWYTEVHQRYGRAEYEIGLARAAAARLRAEREALVHRSRQLESESRSDPLTGVGNRRALDEALRHRVPAAPPLTGPVTVVVVDVDAFKQINDNYGHPVGDAVLRDVALILRRQLREDDICARYGGDEFVLVLAATAEDAAAAVDRARREIEGHRWPAWADLAVSVTCGLAQRGAEDTATTLFARADADLLAAKRARRQPAAELPSAAVAGRRPHAAHAGR
jgi:diguanylate cyclase (GGDEF)-like protein